MTLTTSERTPGIHPSVATAATFVAFIGLLGELSLIWHELVDCYPYKMLTYPPHSFYSSLAHILLPVVCAVAIVSSFFLAKRMPYLVPPVLTALFPLVSLLLVIVLTSVVYGPAVPNALRNFDGYTIRQVNDELTTATIRLAESGVLLGAACSAAIRLKYGRRVGAA